MHLCHVIAVPALVPQAIRVSTDMFLVLLLVCQLGIYVILMSDLKLKLHADTDKY